jgi:hypothetical protein
MAYLRAGRTPKIRSDTYDYLDAATAEHPSPFEAFSLPEEHEVGHAGF